MPISVVCEHLSTLVLSLCSFVGRLYWLTGVCIHVVSLCAYFSSL